MRLIAVAVYINLYQSEKLKSIEGWVKESVFITVGIINLERTWSWMTVPDVVYSREW